MVESTKQAPVCKVRSRQVKGLGLRSYSGKRGAQLCASWLKLVWGIISNSERITVS